MKRARASILTGVPTGIGTSLGGGARGTDTLTGRVFHAWHRVLTHADQNGSIKGEIVTPETLTHEESPVEEVDDTEELLVEEVSIDGLCGVY